MGPTPIRSLCVYCGSQRGVDDRHHRDAEQLGDLLARSGVRLVFGGGSVGLMGVVADAVMAGGGEVLGVIPRGLFSTEQGHRGITELVEVGSMHERKQRMAAEADAFLALPGGLGTLEELAEIATWAQIGIHDKPVAVLDTGGFWTPLTDLLDSMVTSGFLRPANRDLVLRIDRVDEVLERLAAHAPTPRPQLLGPDET